MRRHKLSTATSSFFHYTSNLHATIALSRRKARRRRRITTSTHSYWHSNGNCSVALWKKHPEPACSSRCARRPMKRRSWPGVHAVRCWCFRACLRRGVELCGSNSTLGMRGKLLDNRFISLNELPELLHMTRQQNSKSEGSMGTGFFTGL